MAAGNPTLYDVAREAGVSLATASRSLNGSERRVKDEYRERVLAAAAKLGYTVNASAQAVARGGTSTVALLVSDIADPYFSTIAAGVIRAAESEGLVVTMAVTERDAQREIELVRMLRGQRPRILVLAGSRFADEPSRATLVGELEAFESAGGRVVVIGQEDLPFATVAIDNAGATALARSLVELGYRRFAVLAGPADLVTARDRAAAFAAGLPTPPVIVHGAFSRDAGYAAAHDLDLDGIDAVFAVNDVMAIGAMSALRDRGVDVPGAVAVAGYDDIPTARDVSPALTTVHLPLEEAGAASVRLALGQESSLPSADVVLRASTPAR
ncbi:LacI family DNA-binding transcriptional regulator [Salinibacterium soli]|uniref:LacI family DNA-binding transcriptional regulator n=1 Tax=Antiquaquibacter soli TaxID=3064523 RepID=A0ABT9BMY7_9MICO|nr:LacI family DNA-binding transcriptional regulator [Protaetiibacter sp. WY-16]MDO7880647.1 LacI family DNA-binding transcriptional regulator [Protaetiibacter sp. WY-16]